MKKLMALQTQSAPTLSSCRDDISPAVEQLYQKMTAKKAEERFQSMSEVVTAIEHCMSPAAQSGHLPSLTQDASLQAFLEGQSDSSVTILKPSDETIKDEDIAIQETYVSDVLGGTDPTMPPTMTGRRHPKSKTSKAGWLADKKIMYGVGGGVALFLLVLIFITIGGSDDKTTSPTSTQTESITRSESTTTSNGEDRTPFSSNRAKVFDGVDDYVEIPELSLDDLPLPEPLTIELKVRADSIQNSANVLTWMGDHWIAVYQFVDPEGNNSWGVGRRTEDGSEMVRALNTVNVGEWIDLAAVWDGQEFQLFLDGVPQETVPQSFNMQPLQGGLFIGGAPDEKLAGHEGGRWFHGAVRELRITHRALYSEGYQPEHQFSKSPETLALYQFGLDGQNIGVTWVNQLALSSERVKKHALLFNGGEDRVEIPTLLPPQGSLTVELWIKPRMTANGLIAMADGDFAYSLWHSTNTEGFSRKANATKASAARGDRLYEEAKDRWTHYAGVWDGSKLYYFVNGKRVGEEDGAAPMSFKFRGTRLGMAEAEKWGKPSSLNFNGEMHEVRISETARYLSDFTPPKHFTKEEDTLALYYFDEGSGDVLKDSSGNGHDGQIVGATWVNADGSQIEPNPNYALRFDGVDDHVEIPDLKFDPSAPLTYEAWCDISPNKPAEQAPLDPLFATNSLSELGAGYVLIYDRDNNSYWMAHQNLQGQSAVSNQLFIKDVEAAELHHVAAVWTPTEKRIYLDGQLVARGADPLPRLETAYTDIGEVPTIGRATLLHNSLERFFKGRISEIRISESAKYADDFTPQQNLSKDDDALILYHFDEGSGSILNDHSGNNHHGTIHGATWVNADGSPIEQTEDPYRIDREVAEWVLSMPGKNSHQIEVFLESGHQRVLKQGDPLPAEPFSIFSLKISGQTLNSQNMERISRLPRLAFLDFWDCKLEDDALRELSHPVLGELSLGNAEMNLSGLGWHASLPNLSQLTLDTDQVDDQWEFLERLPSLTGISFYGNSLPDLKPLSQFPKLRMLKFYNLQSTPELVTLSKENPNLTISVGDSDTYDLIGNIAESEGIRTLVGNNIPIKIYNPRTRKVHTISSVAQLADHPDYHSARTKKLPDGCRLTPEDLNAWDLLSGPIQNVHTTGLQNADGFCAVLASRKELANLSLTGSDLTDAGLKHLESLVGLRYLRVEGTAVSKEAIASFKHRVPGCGVASDFGVFQPEHRFPPTSSENDYALSFDGVNDFVEISSLKFDDFGTDSQQPFTVEFDYKPSKFIESQSNQYLISRFPIGIYINGSNQVSCFLNSETPTGKGLAYAITFPQLELGTKYRLALVYDGESLNTFLNGKKQNISVYRSEGSVTTKYEGPITIRRRPSLATQSTYLGCSIDVKGNISRFAPGLLDEVHFSNVARHHEDYTPQTRLEADEHTLTLYHFDEGEGDVLKDSSSNGHDGKIIGAKWINAEETPVVEPLSSKPLPANTPFTAEQAKEHQQAWAEYLGVTVEKSFDLGDGKTLEMVLIPPGEFLMGSPAAEIEAISA